MIPTLLAILVPPVPADGGSPDMAGTMPEANGQSSAEQPAGTLAFDQLLHNYQARPAPSSMPQAMLSASSGAATNLVVAALEPAAAPGQKMPEAVNAPAETEAVPVTIEEVRAIAASYATRQPAPVAQADHAPDAAPVAGAEEAHAEAGTGLAALPVIDPHSAFSLIPSPIAYTTDTEIAVVVVDAQASQRLAALPENAPAAAFALLADLAPAAGSQRLSLGTLTPPPAVDAVEAAALPLPVDAEQVVADAVAEVATQELAVDDAGAIEDAAEDAVALVGPEVTLPQYPALVPAPQASAVDASAPVAPVMTPEAAPAASLPRMAAASAPAPQADGAEGRKSWPEFELEPPVESASVAMAAEDTRIVAAPMGGPLQPLADAEAPVDADAPVLTQPVGAPSSKAPVSNAAPLPSGDAQGQQASADDSQGQGGAHAQQGRTAPHEAMRVPAGDADGVNLEKSAVTEPPVPDDFAALLNDKTAQQLVSAQAHAMQDPAAHRDVSQVKIAHAQADTPVEDQISVRIRQAMDHGVDEITIKLNPPELGRLHIKLEIAQDGRAQVLVTADNKETFDMLRNDARGLERALGEAGVKTDSGSLQFDLRGQSNHQGAAADFGNGQPDQEGQPRGNPEASGERGTAPSADAAGPHDELALSLHQGEEEYRITATSGVDIKV